MFFNGKNPPTFTCINFNYSLDNNPMEILLSKIMHKRNLTVRQVEQMTKVPKSTINDIMNGKSPRLDTLEQLAAGLKVRISDLYDSPYK